MGGIQSCFSPAPYVELKANNVNDTILTYYTNLASAQLGSTLVSASDQYYGNAKHMLRDYNPTTTHQRRDGTHDGWQTRRHLRDASAIVKLGSHGHIYGIEINTIGFDDAAPNTATVEAKREKAPHEWDTLLSDVSIKPDSHNLFLLGTSDHVYSEVKLTIYPGSGVARFRCYGDAVPSWGTNVHSANLASAKNGARIIRWTDIKHSNNPNILLDHSKTAEDGWETPHSRTNARNDFIVVQLATPGILNNVVVSTEHFIGNAPESVSVDGCYSTEEDPVYDYSANWQELVSEAPVEPNSKNNKFPIDSNQVFSHLRLTIHPDGGIQHFSAMGHPAPPPVEEKKKEVVGEEEQVSSSSEEEANVPQRKTRARTAKRRTRAAAEKAVETIQDLAPPRRKKQRST
ncbi:galactose-binding like protein [Lichtheimia hyalospora FSU 10163]|nr:galactose-binding like protein [Lichtheimia hyalospora FSU 10163]